MPDIQIQQPSAVGDFNINSYTTHLIDPSKKDARWAYEIFIQNRKYFNTAFGGWYFNEDADLIKQFAYGNQPVARYKIIFDPQDKEAIYMGLNWSIAPVIPVLRARVLAELANIPTEVECEAVDEMANSQRNMDKLRLKMQPLLDKKLAELSKAIGYEQPIKSGIDKKILNSPMNGEAEAGQAMQPDLEDDDEIAIYMDRDSGYYNQDVELANELAIQSLFKYTDFNDILTLCKEDAFDFGMCAFRCYIDSYTGLPVFQYLNPSRLYIQKSKHKDYHDVNMWYYPVPSTLAELLQDMGGDVSEEEAKEIWEKSAKRKPAEWQGGYPAGYNWDWRRWSYGDLRKVEVDRFYFEVKTNDTISYEVSKTKSGGTKMKQKSVDYEPPADSQYEKKKENYWAECWYGGYYIEGLKKVYQWGKLYNQDRDKDDPQKSHSSLNIYKFSEKGLTEQAIAMADDYQTLFLKRQHLIIHSLPKGISFNWDALVEVDYGNAGRLTKDKLLQMYFQTGNTIHRTIDEAGDPLFANANSVHQILENGIDPNIVLLTQTMLESKNEIAGTFGIPPIESSVNPNPKLLVGVQQSANAASISSRHFLYEGFQRVIERAGEYLSAQLQYIAKNNPQAWDRVKGFVGVVNAAVVESMDGLPMHTFGIYAKNVPTEQEMAQFKQLVMNAYQQGQIDLADVIQVFFMKNIKLSVKLFVLKRKKMMAQAQQAQMQQMQAQQASEQQIAQLKLALQQLDNKGNADVATIQGQTQLILGKMQEQGDTLRKMLAEMNKEKIKGAEMEKDDLRDANEHYRTTSIMDKEHNQNKELIDLQKEADIALEKAKPKPPKAKAK